MAAGLAFWSVMTGDVRPGAQLLGTVRRAHWRRRRRGGASPAAFSLLADYFPPHRLARAISVYSMGLYFGAGLALMIGGSVVQGRFERTGARAAASSAKCSPGR